MAKLNFYMLFNELKCYNSVLFKPCPDERQNGFKGLKLKRCKFLQPFFTLYEHDCICLKTLKHFRFKCLRAKTTFSIVNVG